MGAKNSPAQSWSFLILPYLEQVTMTNALNLSKASIDFANSTVVQSRLAMFNCPSDPNAGAMWLSPKPTANPHRAKGNYVVNWGNSDYVQNMTATDSFAPADLGAFGTVVSIRGPFRVNNTTTAITPFSMKDLIDGSSNTMMISELKIAPDVGGKSDAVAISGREPRSVAICSRPRPGRTRRLPTSLTARGLPEPDERTPVLPWHWIRAASSMRPGASTTAGSTFCSATGASSLPRIRSASRSGEP